MRLLWLTLRNLLRNRRRTLITLSSVVVGCASLIFVWGFIDGINTQMVENSTGYLTGHMKLHRAGFHDSKELNIAINEHNPDVLALASTPGIAGMAPRLEGYALASVGEKSRMVQIVGISPVSEPSVTRIRQAMVSGRYLLPGDTNQVLLGDDALKAFDAEVGGEVILITQAADGSIGADRYTVVGSFNTGIEVMDRNLVFLPLSAAQELFSLWGRITGVALRLPDRRQLPAVQSTISEQIGEDFELLSWQQMMPAMSQMMEFHEVVAYVVLFVVFTVVSAGIANTILMSVMERTREFGVMMALGTQRGQILALVLSESLVIGLLGLLLGSLLGVGINQYFAETGINLGQFTEAMETMPGLSGTVYPVTDAGHVWLVNGLVLVVALLPALYPAWRASRLSPILAIRGLLVEYKFRLPWRASHHRGGRWIFWQIAFRSMFRNYRRSLLTAGATAFGLAAYLFLYAFTDGFFEQMIENTTGQLSGHLQISPVDFRQDHSPKLQVSDYPELMRELESHPDVEAVAPRVVVKGMLASARKNLPVELTGILPERERQVTRLYQDLSQGQYVEASAKRGIVIGRKLASELSVLVGDKLVFTTQQADGNLGSSTFSVTGIFDTGSDVFDSGYAFVNFQPLQQLMGFTADQSSLLAARLSSRFDSQALASELNQKLGNPSLVAEPWEQIMPVVVQMVDMTKIDFYLILVVVFIVVAMGVMNTMLMSVLERTREFGVMMAMGTQAGQILRLVIYEAIVLGAVGMMAGSVMGVLVALYFGHRGIDLSGLSRSMETIPGMTDTIYPTLIFGHLWLPSLLLFLCGVVVSVYPALRAAQLSPVEAIRHG